MDFLISNHWHIAQESRLVRFLAILYSRIMTILSLQKANLSLLFSFHENYVPSRADVYCLCWHEHSFARRGDGSCERRRACRQQQRNPWRRHL
jgi:hypothetical protein